MSKSSNSNFYKFLSFLQKEKKTYSEGPLKGSEKDLT
jgi:hypothetical protein